MKAKILVAIVVVHCFPMFLSYISKSYLSISAGVAAKRTCAVARMSSSVEPVTVTDENDLGLPTISWYPGHIAKAERELGDYIKKVDVVIELRDARIPHASTHPMVPKWVGNKPLIVAVARLDQVSPHALQCWKEYYAMHPAHEERPDAKVFFIDGKLGTGVQALKKEALKAGAAINEKRQRKGIQPRAVRAAVIGFPNVGKSALINRLLGKRMALSRNMPGVTKALRWVRLGGDASASDSNLELLDSPGIIPAKQFDARGACLLAMCNDIGEASYDRITVAGALCDELNRLHRASPGYVDMAHIVNRYKLPFETMTGEEIVHQVANNAYQGNGISAADKILGDFRKGLMGYGSLEAADRSPKGNNQEASSAHTAFTVRPASERSGPGTGARGNDLIANIGKGEYEGW
jgi:ribosome biogenesis GTPase A